MGDCGSKVQPDDDKMEIKKENENSKDNNKNIEKQEQKVVEAIKHKRAKKNILFGDSLPEDSNFVQII